MHLLVIGGIDEVTTCLIVSVEELETRILVHGTHSDGVPLISDALGTEDQRRNVDRCTLG